MKSESIKVSVSIVYYDDYHNVSGVKSKLDIFLRLIENLNNNKYIYKVLVIDNSPFEILRKKLIFFKKVIYYFCNKNIGFSRGHNLSANLFNKQK